MSTCTDADDKNAKYQSQQLQQSQSSSLIRKIIFYSFLLTLLLDTYHSKAEVLNHLTLWSWTLHTLCFELSLSSASTCPITSKFIRLLHGPSFCGAHALFAMYLWTLAVNPTMEFDLAPEGRADWLIYARGVWLHLIPVVVHWWDIQSNGKVLREVYQVMGDSKLFQFWVCVGGYFAMGLTWEQVNGDAAATYNVTIVTPETYVNVGKVIGVVGCVVAFVLLKPKLIA